MAGATSLEAVKRKIKSLQGQADNAEEKAERLQKDLQAERKARDQVSMFTQRIQPERSCLSNYAHLPQGSLPPVFSAHVERQFELITQ